MVSFITTIFAAFFALKVTNFIEPPKKTKWSLDPWMNSLKLMC